MLALGPLDCKRFSGYFWAVVGWLVGLDVGELFEGLTAALRAGPKGLGVGVAHRKDGLDAAAFGHAEEAAGRSAAFDAEPGDAGADSVRIGREHDALDQAAFVEGFHLDLLGLALGDDDYRRLRAGNVPCGVHGRRRSRWRIGEAHPGQRLELLPVP